MEYICLLCKESKECRLFSQKGILAITYPLCKACQGHIHVDLEVSKSIKDLVASFGERSTHE